MLVKAKYKGFYNKTIINPDTVFNYDENNELPNWVIAVESMTTQKNKTSNSTDMKVAELSKDKREAIIKRAAELGLNGNLNNYKVKTIELKIAEIEKNKSNEASLLKELEDLRTEALDKDIFIDVENKSVTEQIKELKIALRRD